MRDFVSTDMTVNFFMTRQHHKPKKKRNERWKRVKKIGIEIFLATIQKFLYCKMSTSHHRRRLIRCQNSFFFGRIKRASQPHLLYVTSGKGMNFVFLLAVISKLKSKKRVNLTKVMPKCFTFDAPLEASMAR